MKYQGKYSRQTVLEQRRLARKRKKASVAFASLALVGLLVVGGTLAYLVAKADPVSNTFQPSEVTCMVEETMRDNIKSDVKVKNTGDAPAYIRATVVANWVNSSTGEILGKKPVAGIDYSIVFANDDESPKWVRGKDGYWYWTGVVPVGELTSKAFVSSCQPSKRAPADGYVLQIDVLCSAIQAEGVNVQNVPAVVDAWGPVVLSVNTNDVDNLLDDTLSIDPWVNQ